MPRSQQLTWLFLGRDSDLQSTGPRTETRPAEELHSWEKRQRAPLRYTGSLGGGVEDDSPVHLSTDAAPAACPHLRDSERGLPTVFSSGRWGVGQ